MATIDDLIDTLTARGYTVRIRIDAPYQDVKSPRVLVSLWCMDMRPGMESTFSADTVHKALSWAEHEEQTHS